MSFVDGGLVFRQHTRLHQDVYFWTEVGTGRSFIAVQGCEPLNYLGATAVPVHVAKSADVHKNIEPHPPPRVKGAECFVVTSAMAQAQPDDLSDAGFGKMGDLVADLAIGMVRDGIEKRC